MPGVRVDANVGGSDAGMNTSSDPGSRSAGSARPEQELWHAARPAGGGFHLAGRRNSRAARRERRGQVHPDQGGDRRLPARCRHRPPRRRRGRAALGQGRGRCGDCDRLSGGQSAAEPVGGAKPLSRQAADAVRPGARGRDAPCRHRAARGVRSAYRRRRAARKLFGRGAAHRRDRARRRPVGAGADPRRADREPRSPRGRDPLSR